jgi:hypothetical protein
MSEEKMIHNACDGLRKEIIQEKVYKLTLEFNDEELKYAIEYIKSIDYERELQNNELRIKELFNNAMQSDNTDYIKEQLDKIYEIKRKEIVGE